MKTIKVRWTRRVAHYWRSRDELIRDVLQWTSHGLTKAGRPASTYIQQLCAGTEWKPEDMPEAMDYREGWREREKYIRAGGVTRWWWWWWLYLHWIMPLSMVTLFSLFEDFLFIPPCILLTTVSCLVSTLNRVRGKPLISHQWSILSWAFSFFFFWIIKLL